MRPEFPARRRAEQFNSLVEGTSGGGDDARSGVYLDFVELVELVAAVRAVPQPQPRPAYVADLRERLLAEAVTTLLPIPARSIEARLTVTAPRSNRERRVAVLVGGLAMAGAAASLAVAAQSALPGEPLYSVKRAIEDVHTGVGVNDSQKGSTLLANASGRLGEVGELSLGGDLGDTVSIDSIEETLDTFTEQAEEASELLIADFGATGDERSITELRTFTSASITSLARLEPVIPSEARPTLLDAAQTVLGIEQQAIAACPACEGPGITDLPAVLVSARTDLPPAGVDDLPDPSATATPEDGEGDGTDVEDPTGLPTLPVPSAPVPSAPVPSAPVPSAPVPSGPIPSGPIPSGPIPSGPIPSGPVPSAPVPTVTGPPVPVPTVPGPPVPVPTVPAPPVPVPTVPAPPVPEPTLPVPTLPVPTLPLPTLLVPTILPVPGGDDRVATGDGTEGAANGQGNGPGGGKGGGDNGAGGGNGVGNAGEDPVDDPTSSVGGGGAGVRLVTSRTATDIVGAVMSEVVSDVFDTIGDLLGGPRSSA